MKALFAVIGVLLIIGGILAGLYVGFWVMFVGGLMDIINAIKAPVTEATVIGFGVLKMFFAGVVGAVTFWVCTAIGGAFLYGSGKF